jgi:predicted RND superfamily exporter protein
MIEAIKWWIIIIIPVLVLTFGTILKDVAFDGGYKIWFDKDSDVIKEYETFQERFGNDNYVTIFFQDDQGIFRPKAIETVLRLTKALMQVPFATNVDSITNYAYIHIDGDDILIDDFIARSNLSLDKFQNLKTIAINDPLLRDAFISRDGLTTMIALHLSPKVDNGKDDYNLLVHQAVEKVLDQERARSGYRFYMHGVPAITDAFVSIATKESLTFTPIAIFMVMFLLWLLFRRLNGALLPMAVVGMSFMVVLSIQIFLGYKLNNFTANMPVFLIAIGIADAVHIYAIWLMFRKEGLETKEAVIGTLEKNFLPIMLTSVTTMVGFLSLTISEIVPIKTLGIATASGALLAFIFSVVFMPAVLLLYKQPVSKKEREERWIEHFSHYYATLIIMHSKKIFIGTLVVFVMIGAGLFFVKVDSNTIRYFDTTVPIRQATHFIQDNITGPMMYEIIVDSKANGAAKDPEFLQAVERFSNAFKNAFSDVRQVNSLVNVIKQTNQMMHANDPTHYTLPPTKEHVAQYLLFISDSVALNKRLDINERYLRISAHTNIVNNSDDFKMLEWIDAWWAKTPYSIVKTGRTVMFAYMQYDVTKTLIYSISIALFIISILMLFIFKQVRLLPLYILPNILPIVLTFGVMGWLHIDIDIGVALSGAIILGVAVDDTIHFLAKYFHAKKSGLNEHDTLVYVMRYSGSAIMFTTLILTLSFALFAFSDFVPNSNFGIVTAAALVIAMVTDLLLLPVMLRFMDRKRQ